MSMEIPRHWRLKKQRYMLVGVVCPHCDEKIFPPREVCPYCGPEPRELFTMMANVETNEEAIRVATIAEVVVQ